MHATLRHLPAFADAAIDPATIRYDAPTALVVADDPGRRERLARIAAGRGCFPVVVVAAAHASERIELQTRGLILIDLAEDRGVELDRLIDQIERAAASRLAIALIAAPHLIDLAARVLLTPGVEMLVDPRDAEIDETIAALLAPADPWVRDSAADANGPKLRQLSEEIGRIARTLAGLSAGVEAGAGAEPRGAATRLRTARAEIRQRRMREQYFDRALFADPAWDMLLDLAAAELERRRVAVSSLCIAAAVPATTALRWIAQMTEQGLLARYPDPDDGRRVFIALTDAASTGMTRYLDACGAARPR